MPRSDQSEKRKEKKMESISVLLVQKFSRCRIFACVARCLPFVRLSDDLVARLVGTRDPSTNDLRTEGGKADQYYWEGTVIYTITFCGTDSDKEE